MTSSSGSITRSIALIALIIICTNLDLLESSYTTDVLRPAFEKTFKDKCLKYPFVHQYWRNLENPPTKNIVHFVFHEHGLRNGGFGDRIAGLITATAMALRFNRTLVIESANGFDKLFRPYHPNDKIVDFATNATKYNYMNWTSWSPYDYKYCCNDNTEYDLWNCVNVNGKQTTVCGMDWGDSDHPIIKIRGNRAYLCKWDVESLPVHNDMVKLGVTKDSDLYEVSGCLTRLAMWPTDRLWDYVDRVMQVEEKRLFELKKSANVKAGRPVPASDQYWNYQVGVHFRCGDHAYLHPGDHVDQSCEHDYSGLYPHSESDYMRYGTPVDVGKCARRVIENLTTDGVPALDHKKLLRRSLQEEHQHQHQEAHAHHHHRRSLASLAAGKEPADVLLFVASDNPASAKQMSVFANTSAENTIISPHGCHVEIDASMECAELTFGYWLILAMSDILVSQSDKGGAVSAFSRYAQTYGLKDNSWRDGKDCDRHINGTIESRIWHGNWFCF